MNRRTFLRTTAPIAVVGVAGCVDGLMEEGLELSATQARVTDSAADSTGYEMKDQEPVEITEAVSYKGQEREVTLTNWKTTYSREFGTVSGAQDLAQFVVYTTPTVNLFGQELNPLGQMDTTGLINVLGARYGNITGVYSIGETTVESLGMETDVSEFEGTANIDGYPVDMKLHFSRVRHEGDFVMALGGYPEDADDRDNIHTLIENITHDVDDN